MIESESCVRGEGRTSGIAIEVTQCSSNSYLTVEMEVLL